MTSVENHNRYASICKIDSFPRFCLFLSLIYCSIKRSSDDIVNIICAVTKLRHDCPEVISAIYFFSSKIPLCFDRSPFSGSGVSRRMGRLWIETCYSWSSAGRLLWSVREPCRTGVLLISKRAEEGVKMFEFAILKGTCDVFTGRTLAESVLKYVYKSKNYILNGEEMDLNPRYRFISVYSLSSRAV